MCCQNTAGNGIPATTLNKVVVMGFIGTCQPIVMRNRIDTGSLNNTLTARHTVTEVGMMSVCAREGGA